MAQRADRIGGTSARARLDHLREATQIFQRRLAIAGLVAIAASTSLNAQAAPASTQHLQHSNLTPGLQHAMKLRRTDPNRVLNIAVSLQLQHGAALQTFIQRASDRHSPAHGHYLAPTQFAALYGPRAADVQTVVDHLRGHGLAVTSVSANRTLIDATGTVSATEAAFDVTINDWHDRDANRDFFGNENQPSLPASIAPLVVGVMGLNNHYPLHRIGSAAPHVGGGQNGGYTPVQLKTAYDVNPLAAAGHDGSGQTLGLFELNGFNQTNIDVYDTKYYGHTLPAVPYYLIDGSTGTPGGEVEVELDIEVMHAFAPGASVIVWEGPNTDIGAADTYNAMVSSNTTPVNSTSWGDCEPNLTNASGYVNTLDAIFQQAAAQGQTFFAASGDFGPYDCNQTPGVNTTNPAVDYPASDPFITAVGGTSLNLNANNTYQSESAWFSTAISPGHGSGGGLSTFFFRPSWQTGPGVFKSGISNGARQVPDVALDADPATGYSVYATDNGTTGWGFVGGTSAGAPSWAALAAIYNQYAANPVTRGGRLGFANPSLYALASSSHPTAPFHDITTGTNFVANYNPTTGWDFSTGWGTIDAGNLIPELLAANFTLRSWVPVALDASTGAILPIPHGRWYNIPRQRALALNSAVSNSPPSAGTVSNFAAPPGEGRVGVWASWFLPQTADRLIRLLS